MIMKILSTIVLLLTAVTLSAQPDAATCTGQTCTGQGSAIGFATVSFFSETDSSAVYGALADSTGRFSVRIPHGNYRMEIALLGYEKKQRGITIAHDTDLGRIVLDPSEISLQGVEVKAAPIVREADRFIVNVADMPQAIGRTAVEMLKLSPGVWIRDDIAIFGKKGAKVMINNRLLRETGEDLINYLNQIPAEDILRIEIVPNSGAEYDADMTAGIIKITLKRKRDNGIDGAVGIYYSHAFSNASSTTSPSFNLNYRNDRLSLYASMGTWFSKQIIRITESSAFGQNDASIRSESRLDGHWKSVSPRIGALYEFNDRHSAGLEISYFRNLPGGSETHNRLQKQDKADSTRIASHFLQNQQGYGLGISANYIFKMDTTGSLFKLLLDYYRRDNDDPTDYFSRYTGSQAFDTTYRGDIHTVNDLYAATAAFEIALGPVSKLRTGAKYTLNRMNTAILYEFLRDDAWHRIDRQSNLNRYSENIGALYADFSTKFKNGIGLNVGLRGEYTYAIPATSSTLITDRQNYFGLFPSANLSLPLNKKDANASLQLQPEDQPPVVLEPQSVPYAAVGVFVSRREPAPEAGLSKQLFGQLDHPAQIFADRRIRIGQRKFGTGRNDRSGRPGYHPVPLRKRPDRTKFQPERQCSDKHYSVVDAESESDGDELLQQSGRPPEYGTGIPEQRADDPQRVDARPESELPDSPVMGQHAYERTVQRRRRPPAVAAEKTADRIADRPQPDQLQQGKHPDRGTDLRTHRRTAPELASDRRIAALQFQNG